MFAFACERCRNTCTARVTGPCTLAYLRKCNIRTWSSPAIAVAAPGESVSSALILKLINA